MKNLNQKTNELKKENLFKNKLMAIILTVLGILSIGIENDITAFVFIEIFFAIPLFFAKKNWIN